MGKVHPKLGVTICYARVSTKKQEVLGHSVEHQLSVMDSYCKMRTLHNVVMLKEDYSGGTPLEKRPEGKRISELIEAGNVRDIVIYKLDRMFRDALDCLQNIKMFTSNDINLHIVDMGGMALDIGSPMGKMMIHFLAGFAEWERSQISARTKATMKHAIEKKGIKVGRAPYGLDVVEGKYEINPEEMQAVYHTIYWHDAFQMKVGRIAERLNGMGFLTKRNKPWDTRAVSQVINNYKLKKNIKYLERHCKVNNLPSPFIVKED